jgi:hypothetical protein
MGLDEERLGDPRCGCDGGAMGFCRVSGYPDVDFCERRSALRERLMRQEAGGWIVGGGEARSVGSLGGTRSGRGKLGAAGEGGGSVHRRTKMHPGYGIVISYPRGSPPAPPSSGLHRAVRVRPLH